MSSHTSLIYRYFNNNNNDNDNNNNNNNNNNNYENAYVLSS